MPDENLEPRKPETTAKQSAAIPAQDALSDDTEVRAEVVERVLAMATSAGSISWDDLSKEVDPDVDPVTVDAIEVRLAEIGIAITRDSPPSSGTENGDSDLVEVEEEPSSLDALFETRLADIDLSGVSLDDPVRMYLREIGRVPLLTAEQEVELARAMEQRDHLVRVAHQINEGNPEGEEHSVAATVLGSTEQIARSIFFAFTEGWRYVDVLYSEAYPDQPATTKPRMLAAVLPVTQLPEALLKSVADSFGMTSEALEEELRRRRVEWDLLPREVQQRIEAPDATLDQEEAVILLASASPQIAATYAQMIVRGDLARGKLTEANLRLVVSVAKKYVGRGMSMLDLVQEGNLGLIRAVEKFQHHKGFKFSTYATWWIRQAITRAIADQARTIRIPVHMVETINRLIRTSRRLQQELGREPTSDEIAREMDLTPEKVRDIQKISQEPVSIDMPIGEEEDSNLGDFIEDQKALAPADAASQQMLKEQMETVLSQLSERERRVLELRFGLEDGRSRTLEEVGKEFGVTRERIRQIEAKALRKLRHPTKSRQLRDYLE